MAFKSIAIPALAFAGAVAAQCKPTATVTLQSQGDADNIGSCTTFSGSIAIATDVSVQMNIDGIQVITGDLVADNTVNLPALEANDLESIGGTFALTNMTLLTSLSFPQLSTVNTIQWVTLPRLNSLSFNNGVTKANSVNIFDSQLGSLEGLTLNTVSEMYISNNNQLQMINLPVKTISTAFHVEFNGRDMSVDLPNLVVANNMTLSNVSTINMPSLQAVNQSLGAYGCTFESFAAPNLTSVGGDISFIGNDDVTNVSMPVLTTLGGALKFAENSDLVNITGFPELAQIDGAIDISGNFSEVSLPALKNVEGACNLQSTQDIDTTCNTFNGLHSSGTIQGKVTCAGKESNPGGLGSTPSSSSTSTQKGDAARDLYARSSAVTGVLGVFAALLGML